MAALTQKEKLQKLAARNQIAVQNLPILLEAALKNDPNASLDSVVGRAFNVADLVVGKIDESYAEFGPDSGLALPK